MNKRQILKGYYLFKSTILGTILIQTGSMFGGIKFRMVCGFGGNRLNFQFKI